MAQVALELQPCCGKRSGIGTYAYELAKRLERDGEFSFVGNVFNFLGRNDNGLALEGISMPVRTQKSVPYGVYRRIWHMVPVSYSMMFPRADLSIFFNYIVPPKVSGKVITTIHDLTYLRYPETMDKRNLKRIETDIKRSIDRSDHILVVSEFTKWEVVSMLGVEASHISVVHNAPSITDKLLEYSCLREKYGIEKPYLLYVGTIEPRKNIVRMIRAFEALKEQENIPHQLVLAGGMGWNTEEIKRTIEHSVWREDLVLTGYISGEEKNTLYANAAVFLFPSLYEGFGIPPLEAMHFGCPVICANTASLPEVVGNAAELVDPMDGSSIAEGIFRVISDDLYRDQLIQAGYVQEKKFTWERSAERLKRLCRSVLEK